MIKFKVTCIDTDTVLYIDIHETSKIGTLVRKISEMLQNTDIDIFNSELTYNLEKLEHQRMISSYSDFQYKRKELYELQFIIHKKQHKIIANNIVNIKSEPITIPISSISLPHNTDILTTHLKSLSNDGVMSLEDRLFQIEQKQDIIINLLKNLLKK